VSELEEEVKKYKEELDKALKRASAQPDDEVGVIVISVLITEVDYLIQLVRHESVCMVVLCL